MASSIMPDLTSASSGSLSPVSARTAGAKNTTTTNNNHTDNNSNNNNNTRSTSPRTIHDGNSLLGVIVDRSSFDEDDELTTFGKDSHSVLLMHVGGDDSSTSGIESLPQDISTKQTGGVVMRNGKVRRKLRWKPRFGRKKENLSSNSSVVSALTNRSSATSRSSSTTRSFLSHFSRRSGTSFHTFHSTETPVVTNKANRPKAPQTVMRPNYQDSFDTAAAKHSTIDTEGAQRALPQHKRRGSFSSNFSSKLDSVSEIEDLDDPVASPGSVEVAKAADSITPKPPPSRPSLNGNKLPKPKRPPLFKRRLRNKMNKKEGISSKNSSDAEKKASDNNNDDKPISPTETSQTSQGGLGAHTAPTASLSASISIERENSVLPVLSGDEYEEDRRVHIPGSTLGSNSSVAPVSEREEEEKKEEESDLLLTEEGIEESSLSPTVAEQSIQSGGQQSLQSGNTAAISTNSAPAALQGRRIPSTGRRIPPAVSTSSPPKTSISLTRGGSGGSSPSTSGNSVKSVPTPHKRYNRPVDTMESPARRPGSRQTVPVDLDEGAFLEAEHNLRAIHEMAAEHLAHGEYEEAIEVFEEILRGQQERYGADHYRVGTALHNLGIVHLKKGDYNKAIEICGRAVSVRKEALVPNHPDVAVSLAQLGVAYLESHQLSLALEAFRDALHIRQNFLGPRHPKCSKILNNIGCALYSMEEFEEAKKAFEEALDIQRDTLRNLPSTEGSESNGMQSNALLLSSASTLCNIGSIRLRWGEFDEATVALEEALLIQQSVLGDSHPTVASTVESLELVESAKYCAENPLSPATILMNGAETVCNAAEPTNMASMLGFNSASLDPQQWFANACAPASYTKENDYELKSARLDKPPAGVEAAVDESREDGDDDGSESSSSGSSSDSSSNSDEGDEGEGQEFEAEALPNQVSI